MLENLKKLNPNIAVHSVFENEFKSFGRILKLNTEEIIKVAEGFQTPETLWFGGLLYFNKNVSTPDFDIKTKIKETRKNVKIIF